MKTIKIIDLLLDIVREKEVPKKIKYLDLIWEYDKEIKDYYNGVLWLFYSMNSTGLIDREVEIIEDTPKKIEHIHLANMTEEKRWFAFRDKINEIIDKVNGGE